MTWEDKIRDALYDFNVPDYQYDLRDEVMVKIRAAVREAENDVLERAIQVLSNRLGTYADIKLVREDIRNLKHAEP